VELTRKRQGQNIYELFGKKCSTCNGTGHVENQVHFEIYNLQTKNHEEKLNRIKSEDFDSSQETYKEAKIIEKEILNLKNLNKDDPTSKKENDNDELKTLNSKEKNTITVDLTNDEKIVFSQLGINPLIKKGREYLKSNNFVLLKNNSEEKEKSLDNKKIAAKKVKKIQKSKEPKPTENEANSYSEDKSIKKINANEEVIFSDNNDEIELTDTINNARKKRRRSSASIE
jgi:ribonuclease E